MRPNHIAATLIALFCVAGCIYDFTPVLDEEEHSFVVIEGDILAGAQTLVRAGFTAPLDGKVSWLPQYRYEVFVEREDGVLYRQNYERPVPNPEDSLDAAITDWVGADDYASIDTRRLDVSHRYRLVVRLYKGRTYRSEWLDVLHAAPIDSVSWRVDPHRKEWMSISVTSQPGSDTPYYRWICREFWQYDSPWRTVFYYDPLQNQIRTLENISDNTYWCWRSDVEHTISVASAVSLAENRIVDHEMYQIFNQQQRISFFYCVDVVQESISEEAYRYWNALKKNTFDVGGLFSPQPAECRGNIICDENPDELVLGYISASSVTFCRKFISGANFYDFRASQDRSTPVLVRNTNWKHYYSDLDMRPYEPVEGDDNLYKWLPRRCVDCTVMGGSKRKPSFWPLKDN